MGMPWPSWEPRCSERGCPFPPAPGQSLCQHHIQMFLFNESLTDDSLELDFTKDSNEMPKSRVSIVSAAESGVARWREKKERERERSLVCRVEMALLYRKRRAAGLCICGRVLDIVNRKTCSVCAERNRQQRRRNSAAGLCAHCGKNSAQTGNTLCGECRSRAKGYYHRHWAKVSVERRNAGMCIMCGKRPHSDDSVRCDKCRSKHSQNERARNMRIRVSAAMSGGSEERKT